MHELARGAGGDHELFLLTITSIAVFDPGEIPPQTAPLANDSNIRKKIPLRDSCIDRNTP